MKRTLLLVSLLALTAALVVAWAQNAAKPDPIDERLQGNWKVVAAEAAGMPVPVQKLANLKVTFAKGKYMFRAGNETQTHEYKLDTSKSPKQIDLIQRKEVLSKDSKKSLRVDTRKGIFEVNGDEMKLCYSDDEDEDRPKEFKSKAGTQILSLRLKREK